MNNSDVVATIEHLNLTVNNPDKTAEQLSDIFDWQIRWSGASLDGGYTVHVGEKGVGNSYLALYTHSRLKENKNRSHLDTANLNHIGLLVVDLDETEQRVKKCGFKTFNHADYEPGRRFYFHIDDGIEVEVISYN